MTERGQMLTAYLRAGTYEVAYTCRRPSGDTVVMLRSRPPRQPGVYPSIWLSLRDPQDLALLSGPREAIEQPVPTVVRSAQESALTLRGRSRFALLRALFL
jgi:hypothetical protein